MAAASVVACSSEPLIAMSHAETITSCVSCSEDIGKTDNRLDSMAGSASNGLNMDDIMEYLQCQDASLLETSAQSVSSGSVPLTGNFTSYPVLASSDTTSSTLSLAALQQLASECSTIDLSSLAVDSNVPFVGSNGPTVG